MKNWNQNKRTGRLLRLLVIAALLAAPARMQAQDESFSEEELDAMFLSGDSEIPGLSSWSIDGYLESENQVGWDNSIYKLEARSRVNFKYGDSFTYVFASVDLFFYPETGSSTNGPGGYHNGEINATEFYFAAGENFRFKAGKQLFLWSKADAFHLQNYLNTRDLREMFFKEKDERYLGVFAMDLQWILGDFAVEAAAVPFHTPVLFPEAGSLWAFDFGSSSAGSTNTEFNPDYGEPGTLDPSWAIRAGGSLGIADFHVSYFNGLNSGVIMIPEAHFSLPPGPAPASVVLRPDHSRVQKIGGDIAVAFDKVAIRTEAVYSPDYPALYRDETKVTQVQQTNPVSGQPELVVTRKVDHVANLAYTAGIDYNLWGDYGRVLVEYTATQYLKNESLYEEEFFNDFLLLVIEDKYFHEKLEISANIITKPANFKEGYIPSGQVTWFVHDSLSVALGATAFYADGDRFMELYKDLDLIYFRAKMSF